MRQDTPQPTYYIYWRLHCIKGLEHGRKTLDLQVGPRYLKLVQKLVE